MSLTGDAATASDSVLTKLRRRYHGMTPVLQSALLKLARRALEDRDLARGLYVGPTQTISGPLPGLTSDQQSALRVLSADHLRQIFGPVSGIVGKGVGGGLGGASGYLGSTGPAAIVLEQLHMWEPWAQADRYGIAPNYPQQDWTDPAQPWWAGRLDDVLVTSDTGAIMVVGQGGMWLVSDQDAVCISDDFSPCDLVSLAEDPAVPGRIYAGGSGLFVDDPFWRNILPPYVGQIRQLDITTTHRYLVLATSNGLWWAALPPADSIGPQRYDNFFLAVGPNASGPFASVVASGNTIVATDDSGNLYYGEWAGLRPGGKIGAQQLQLAQKTPALSASIMSAFVGRDALLSHYRYAAFQASGGGDDMAGIARTNDEGKTWEVVLDGNLVVQAFNNGVDAPPQGTQGPGSLQGRGSIVGFNGEVRAVGWTKLLVADQGAWWSAEDLDRRTSRGNFLWSHVHADVRALRIVPMAGTPWSFGLYACTDGGLCSTDDFQKWDSAYNKNLRNLQIHCPSGRAASFNGSMSVSAQMSGIVVAGLQDNHVVITCLAPGNPPTKVAGAQPGFNGAGFWYNISTRQKPDGTWAQDLFDGFFTAILATHEILWSTNSDSSSGDSSPIYLGFDFSVIMPWLNDDGSAKTLPLTGTALPQNADHLANPLLDAVAHPGPWFDTPWNYMLAIVCGEPRDSQGVAIGQPTQLVCGVFGDRVDFPDLSMVPLGDPGTDSVTALFCWDAQRAFVGTKTGNILRFDAGGSIDDALRAPVQEPVVLSGGPGAQGGAYPVGFTAATDGTIFCILGGAGASGPGFVLRRNAQAGLWFEVDQGLFNAADLTAICADDAGRIFVATRQTVFALDTATGLWHLASSGLPACVNPSNLRFQPDFETGLKYLYLGTIGRSLWRATL
jgi:hypothetical protein